MLHAEIRQTPERPISRAFGLVFPKPEDMAKLSPADRRLGSLLAAESGVGNVTIPDRETAPAGQAKSADVVMGATELGEIIGIDLARLLDGRMLVQGTSGAGKSWTLRRLIEQTHGRVQQIIIDPEGEFKSIAERYGHFHVEAHKLDTAALALLGARIRAHRLSVLIDMSELDREGQLQAIAAFFESLINAPRAHWHPCLVFVDEAHLFAPFGGQSTAATSVRKAAIGAVTDLMSRGRKRGLCGILATQRLARMAKSVVSEMHNFVVGLNTLDLDIRRAAETIGWDASKAFDRLPMLEPGDFVAVGPAFSRSPAVLRVGGVETHHRGARPALSAPDDIDAEEAAQLLDLEALMEASAEDDEIRDENALIPSLKAIRAFIRDPAFAVAGRIYAELKAIAPSGARVSDMPAGLQSTAEDIAAGLALLDQFGALEFMGDGEDRAARIEKGMLACL
ncbi:helicase HerA domain-containing protein [Aminobacter carboxidus]|uniref:DUF87 domain-containing protein n=1 Tax=Aminobacter carboxidus TaxID=376165 RepID=A0ABR9GWV2_9HYPH|nr:DUF87 domain-containing protein [Aminobacter carboxidus]MBE1208136.1 DUF87 domain-containing protein [Aminobacter carboxidus]